MDLSLGHAMSQMGIDTPTSEHQDTERPKPNCRFLAPDYHFLRCGHYIRTDKIVDCRANCCSRWPYVVPNGFRCTACLKAEFDSVRQRHRIEEKKADYHVYVAIDPDSVEARLSAAFLRESEAEQVAEEERIAYRVIRQTVCEEASEQEARPVPGSNQFRALTRAMQDLSTSSDKKD